MMKQNINWQFTQVLEIAHEISCYSYQFNAQDAKVIPKYNYEISTYHTNFSMN